MSSALSRFASQLAQERAAERRHVRQAAGRKLPPVGRCSDDGRMVWSVPTIWSNHDTICDQLRAAGYVYSSWLTIEGARRGWKLEEVPLAEEATVTLQTVQEGAAAKLSGTCWSVYLFHKLHQGEQVSQSRIAANLDISQQAVSKAERKLEDLGLLDTHRDERGYRVAVVNDLEVEPEPEPRVELARRVEDGLYRVSDGRYVVGDAGREVHRLPDGRFVAVVDVTDQVEEVQRPQTRGDCIDAARPCPWITCRHHLWSAQRRGGGGTGLRLDGVPPWEMEKTCALDLADEGPQTLKRVGEILGIGLERTRQIQEEALRVLRDSVEGDLMLEFLDGVERGNIE